MNGGGALGGHRINSTLQLNIKGKNECYFIAGF